MVDYYINQDNFIVEKKKAIIFDVDFNKIKINSNKRNEKKGKSKLEKITEKLLEWSKKKEFLYKEYLDKIDKKYIFDKIDKFIVAFPINQIEKYKNQIEKLKEISDFREDYFEFILCWEDIERNIDEIKNIKITPTKIIKLFENLHVYCERDNFIQNYWNFILDYFEIIDENFKRKKEYSFDEIYKIVKKIIKSKEIENEKFKDWKRDFEKNVYKLKDYPVYALSLKDVPSDLLINLKNNFENFIKKLKENELILELEFKKFRIVNKNLNWELYIYYEIEKNILKKLNEIDWNFIKENLDKVSSVFDGYVFEYEMKIKNKISIELTNFHFEKDKVQKKDTNLIFDIRIYE